jgi:hypothetical protein
MYDGSTDSQPVRVLGERVARLAISAGLAVVTWLVLLVGVGLVAGLDSPLELLPLFVVIVMLWPVYLAAPWRPGMTGRVLGAVERNRWGIAAGFGLLLLRWLPFIPGPLLTVLDLPFRSAGVLFGAGLFYRRLFDPAVGRFLLSFGQWYLELFWLFLAGSFLVRLGDWLRSRLDGVGRSVGSDGGRR